MSLPFVLRLLLGSCQRHLTGGRGLVRHHLPFGSFLCVSCGMQFLIIKKNKNTQKLKFFLYKSTNKNKRNKFHNFSAQKKLKTIKEAHWPAFTETHSKTEHQPLRLESEKMIDSRGRRKCFRVFTFWGGCIFSWYDYWIKTLSFGERIILNIYLKAFCYKIILKIVTI